MHHCRGVFFFLKNQYFCTETYFGFNVSNVPCLSEDNINSSIICTILVLDLELLLWRERLDSPTHLQDCKIFFLHLKMYIMKIMTQGAATLCYSICHKVEYFLWLNEAIWGKHWEEDARLLDLGLQSNSSNCLVPILHRQLAQQPNISARIYTDQCLTLTNKLTTPWSPGQHNVWNSGTIL